MFAAPSWLHAALMVAVVGVSLAESQCSQYNSCFSCTPIAGCGWAGDQGYCLSGNNYGPASGLGYSTDWCWAASQCNTATYQYASNSYCTSYNSNCLNCATNTYTNCWWYYGRCVATSIPGGELTCPNVVVGSRLSKGIIITVAVVPCVLIVIAITAACIVCRRRRQPQSTAIVPASPSSSSAMMGTVVTYGGGYQQMTAQPFQAQPFQAQPCYGVVY